MGYSEFEPESLTFEGHYGFNRDPSDSQKAHLHHSTPGRFVKFSTFIIHNDNRMAREITRVFREAFFFSAE